MERALVACVIGMSIGLSIGTPATAQSGNAKAADARPADAPTIGGLAPADFRAALLADSDDEARRTRITGAFGDAHGEFDPPTIQVITAWLDDPQLEVRVAACRLLGFSGAWEPAPLAKLKGMLTDPLPRIRMHAAGALLFRRAQGDEVDASCAVLLACLDRTKPTDPATPLAAFEIAAELSGRDPRFVELVKAGVNDPDPLWRRVAIGGLSQIDEEISSGLLRGALADVDETNRLSAAQRLVLRDITSDDVVEVVLAAAKSADAKNRIVAANTLARLGAERADRTTSMLVALLSDPSTSVRIEAANGLGQFGAAGVAVPEASEAIVALAADADPVARANAAFALGHLGLDAETVVPVLGKLVGDGDASVREFAFVSLAQAGSEVERILPELIACLSHLRPDVRIAAAKTIAQAGAAAGPAVAALARRLDDPSLEARMWAAFALRSIGAAASAAVPGLARALREDPEPGMRIESARALAGIGPGAAEQAAALIAAATKDPTWDVRLWSLFALGEIGVKSNAVLSTLRTAGDDPAPDIAGEAHKALARLEQPHDAAKASYVTPTPPARLKVSAPFLYDGQALLLVGHDSVALVDFSDRADRTVDATTRRESVHVRWRLWIRGAETIQSGSDDLYCDTRKQDDGSFRVGAAGSHQQVQVGPLAADWWGRDRQTGELIWLPEDLRVELASDGSFDDFDLRRFIR